MNVRVWTMALTTVFAISGAAHAQQEPPPPPAAGQPATAAVETQPPAAPAEAPPPAPVVPAAEVTYPRGRISGYMFGDVYYNVTGDPVHRYNAAGADSNPVNIDGSKLIGKDLNGVQLRRIYFQLDNDLSFRVSTRLRLEMDSRALTSDGKIGVYVKGAHLLAKDVIPRANFLFGMVGTPTWETAEDFWQYRSVEKTITDFRGIASSSDLGIQLRGFVDSGHRVGYTAMVGTGTFQRPENDRYKRFYFSLPLNLIRDLKLEPYVDYEGVAGPADRATYKVFAGYELRRIAIGAEVVDRIIHSGTGPNLEPFGFSVFARTNNTTTLGAFARFDRWQTNTRAADRVDSDLYIAGLDWQPVKDVHVMPNVEATQYHARGTAVAPPHHDVQARVTFYYRFSKP